MQRKITKRVIMFLALGMLMAGVLFAGVTQVRAEGMSLADLQAKFPGRKYWNHATQSGHDYNEESLVHSGNCNNPDGYTDTPCTDHYLDIQGVGYYDCNSYGGALQCCGFAYKLADDAYGSMPNSWGTVSVDNAKAGDVIHFDTGDRYGHWAMIIGRNGTTVTLGECNYDLHCRIDWGRQCDLSSQSYTIYSAPWELQEGSSGVEPEPEPVSEYSVSDNGDNTVTITHYVPYNVDNVVIPSEINGKKVTAIGDKAFYDKGRIKSVIIPGTVENIGDEAFHQCYSLISVTIPESVTSIGEKVFMSCWDMENVLLPSSLTSIGKNAFYNCKSLKSVTIPENVETIGSHAFAFCDSLESVIFRNGVKDTGIATFGSCKSLKNVTVPKSVKIIGDSTFSGCESLESITIPDSVTEIQGAAFSGCKSLKNVVIPERIRYLGECAFRDCDSLTEVTIPGSLALDEDDSFDDVIGSAVFSGCDNLSSVILQEGVSFISWYMFEGCASLKNVTIPGSVRWIRGKAFEGTKWLEDRQKENALVIVNNNLIDASLCSGEVIIPDGVEEISDVAFSDCNSLLSVTVPDSVASINGFEFWGCSSLKIVTVLGNRTYISGKLLGYFDPGSFNWSGFYPKGSSKIDGFVICGRSGSKAEEYAKENGFEFQPIPDSGSSQGGSNPPASCLHSYKMSVIPATEKTNGSIVEKCSKCGNERSRTVIYAANSISLSKTSYTYNGKTCRPSVTVKDSIGKTLKSNTDYTVSFPEKAKDVGKYILTVTLRGNYSGIVKKTFDIVPKGTSISKVAAKKNGFTVKWKKQAKQITGYEVQYSTSSKFTKKSTKTEDAGKSRMTSKSVSKLKSKKK